NRTPRSNVQAAATARRTAADFLPPPGSAWIVGQPGNSRRRALAQPCGARRMAGRGRGGHAGRELRGRTRCAPFRLPEPTSAGGWPGGGRLLVRGGVSERHSARAAPAERVAANLQIDVSMYTPSPGSSRAVRRATTYYSP